MALAASIRAVYQASGLANTAATATVKSGHHPHGACFPSCSLLASSLGKVEPTGGAWVAHMSCDCKRDSGVGGSPSKSESLC